MGFGPTAADIDRGAAIGTRALIDELLERPLTTLKQWRLPPLNSGSDQAPYLGRQLQLMATSPNPLQERLAWILQGIVVVGVTDAVAFSDLRGHLTRLRVDPFASYTRLLRDTAVMPAMMKYLNGDENSASHPNQNYARELMELFSLGRTNLVTGRSNYSQNDVIQVARALTGYTLDWTTGKIAFDESNFDDGQKRFFGKNQGDARLPDVITAVSRHPSYRYFIPARLFRELVGYAPDRATLRSLGELWGTDGDVRAVVSAIVRSPAFLAPEAIGTRIKSPVELLASGARVMGFPLGSSDYGWQLSSFMNQNPFFPPNVAGWPEGAMWLNAGVDMTWGSIVQDFAAATAASSSGRPRSSGWRSPHAPPRPPPCGCAGSRTSRRRPPARSTRTRRAGSWDRYRAAGTLALVLVSPEFLVNSGGPAMTLTRRSFLAHSGLMTVAATVRGSGWTSSPPSARSPAPRQSRPSDHSPWARRSSCSIDLQGGNDATNMLIDPTDPWYYDVAHGHGSIAIAESALLPLGGVTHALHPSMPWLASRWTSDQDVAFVLGPGENVVHEFSHFAAMHYRQVADFTGTVGTGWLGRFNDLESAGSPFASVSIEGVHPSLVGTKTPVLTVPAVQYFDFNVDWRWEETGCARGRRWAVTARRVAR